MKYLKSFEWYTNQKSSAHIEKMREFIDENRDKIYDIIKQRPSMKNVPLTDQDLEEFIWEDEILYNMAREYGVEIEDTGAEEKAKKDEEEYFKFQKQWDNAKKTENF